MKVWFPALRCGTGADVFTERLAAGLGSRGIVTQITWFDRRYEFWPDLLKHFPPPTGTTIIHANSWTAFAFHRHSLPLVTTEHLSVLDTYYQSSKSILQSIYHRLIISRNLDKSYANSDRVVCVSHFAAAGLKRTFSGINPCVINNGVDTDFFHASHDQTRQPGPFRLLFVGNLSKRKGADLLQPLLHRLGNRFELRYTSGLREHKSLVISKNCTPIGKLDSLQLRSEYHHCDALLFPSRFEGFGLVAAEAMSCGKPVIGFTGHALDEFITNGKHGWLVPMNDLNALADACYKLADNLDDSLEMGMLARKHIVQSLSINSMITSYINLYNGALKNQVQHPRLK